MAKIPLKPIGSAKPWSADKMNQHRDALGLLEGRLKAKREKTKEGWGPTYVDRVREKGKLPTWERIELLADSLAEIFPINTLVNDDLVFGEGKQAKSSPSAGVLTAFVKIHGRWVVVIANDNTVASGSWWPKTPEKIIRAQEIALKLRLPVVYLVDCSGLYLPEQSKSFPGKYGAGHIFKMNSELSAAGVPQIAGVFGDCIAGGGYMPLISDRVFMTEQAYMVIAGAALIQGAKSQHLSSLDIGGANVHVHLSGCADDRAPSDAICLQMIRDEISKTSSSAADFYRSGVFSAPPFYRAADIETILPPGPTEGYDVREIIARLVDDSLFWEISPHYGHEVTVGIARINGLYVGIAANVQGLLPHPQEPGKKRPGGILYREGVSKLAIFSRACNDDGIPIVWLQDIAGFDVGLEAEKQGLLGYGSSLIYSNSTNQTPMITVLLRKASGAGYYAMAGMPYDPVLQLSTMHSRLSVMEGRTLAIGAFNSKLDDNFQIVAQNDEERAQIEAGMKAVEKRIEKDMDPFVSAKQMDTDEIVCMSEMRSYLSCIVEATYQSQGSRRIKNPRIWSLHDLALMVIPGLVPGIQATTNVAGLDPGNKSRDDHNGGDPAKSVKVALDGMLYLRQSPSDPQFVSEGDTLNPGQTIALIEVMKCFYPIKFEGKQPTVVKSIHARDQSSVRSGDVILTTI